MVVQNRYEEGLVAWDIIRKGPERLQSQFAAGYGMVLNLLYTRTMDEAKAFIGRSFSSYLSKCCPKKFPQKKCPLASCSAPVRLSTLEPLLWRCPHCGWDSCHSDGFLMHFQSGDESHRDNTLAA